MSSNQAMINMFYFASTTLTTVGFGDFHPKSDSERIFCAAIMMFGVMIFSYILGVFLEMVTNYSMYFGDYDNGCELNKFFSVLAKFNDGFALDKKVEKPIREYFAYRWKHDVNLSLQDEQDQYFYRQVSHMQKE